MPNNLWYVVISGKQIRYSYTKYVNIFFLTKLYPAKDVYGPLFSLSMWELIMQL